MRGELQGQGQPPKAQRLGNCEIQERRGVGGTGGATQATNGSYRLVSGTSTSEATRPRDWAATSHAVGLSI